MDTALPIINRVYEVYKSAVDITNHLEKRWRYGLGQSLENTILGLLENLIQAKNAPGPVKVGYLLKASAGLEITRLKLRLFLELGLANETKIFQTQSRLEDIGRQLGGWIKSLNT